MMWIPAGHEFSELAKAKEAVQRATEGDAVPHEQTARAKTTTLRRIISSRNQQKPLAEGVGRYSRRIDVALPGPHTRILYDSLSRREGNVLVRLRTGVIRLNGYLHQIGGAELAQCACDHARETVEHFLFRCRLWNTQ